MDVTWSWDMASLPRAEQADSLAEFRIFSEGAYGGS